MGKVIVVEFVSLDGVMEDPDGGDGTARGGWAFRYGPEAVAGDKFKLGPILDSGALLMGRVSWQKFSKLWPTRSDDFSKKMNAIRKYVVTRSIDDVRAWSNSVLLDGDLLDEVARLKEPRDLVVIGSASVARALMAQDMVDEYRLMVFPIVLGQGQRLFENGTDSVALQLQSAEKTGAAVLLTYARERVP